jgi:hypothetical protein
MRHEWGPWAACAVGSLICVAGWGCGGTSTEPSAAVSLDGSWSMRVDCSDGSRVCSQSGSLDLKQEGFDKSNYHLDFSGSLRLGDPTCPDLGMKAGAARVYGLLIGEPRVGSLAAFDQLDCGGSCIGYYGFNFTVKDPNLLSGTAFRGLSQQVCDWVAERRG